MAAVSSNENAEALQYWCDSSRSVFKRNRLANERFDRLLRGIAQCISSNFGQQDHNDLTPSQLSAFYRTVGGNYDPLFLQMPPQSIAFIYKSLGCLHSLQPNPAEGGYSQPSIPALKPSGFVTWQTIQLLLGPEEHVPLIQNALRKFDVLDPEDGTPFPKYIPREAFPDKPDEHMVSWHQGVSERLLLEAQAEAEQHSSSASRRSSTDQSTDEGGGGGGERADAVQYFSNPFYRNHDGRPAIVRHISRAPALAWKGGQMVVRTVLTLADPAYGTRRKSMPERANTNGGEDDGSDGPTPIAIHPSARTNSQQYQHQTQRPRYVNGQAPRPPVRHDSKNDSRRNSPPRGRKTVSQYSTGSSSGDSPPPPSSHRQVRAQARRPQSHEPPLSSRTQWVEQQSQWPLHPQPTTATATLSSGSATGSTYWTTMSENESVQQSRHHNRNDRTHQIDHNRRFHPSQSPPFAAKIANLNVQQPTAGYFDLQRPGPSVTQRASSYELRSSENMENDSASNSWNGNGSAKYTPEQRSAAPEHEKPHSQQEYDLHQSQSQSHFGNWGWGNAGALVQSPTNQDDNSRMVVGRTRLEDGLGSTSGSASASGAVVGVHGRRYVNETPWR